MALGTQFKYSDEGDRQGGEAWQQGVKEHMGRSGELGGVASRKKTESCEGLVRRGLANSRNW